jgi:hypothetical protein
MKLNDLFKRKTVIKMQEQVSKDNMQKEGRLWEETGEMFLDRDRGEKKVHMGFPC